MGRERTRWSRTMNFTAVIGFAVLIVFLATPSDSGAQETTGDASTNKAACPYMKGGEQPPCPRAAAGMPPCPCPAKAGICAASIQKRLNLTEQQVADMDRIRADYQTQAADLSERARGLSMKMETLLRDPEAKTADIEKLNRKLIKLKSQKKQKQLGYLLQLRAVLTPDQVRALPPGALKKLLAAGCTGKGFRSACPYAVTGERPCTKNQP